MRSRTMLVIGLVGLMTLAAGTATAEWRHDNEEECARVDARLKEIEGQRRAGYSAKRGRQLQAQRDKLEQKRREKCR